MSGGAGADATPDGEVENAIHSFQFMGGRLATMIWEDGVSQHAGDDDAGLVLWGHYNPIFERKLRQQHSWRPGCPIRSRTSTFIRSG